ncbi:hypothetical protein [Paracidovorax citrulli]
MAAFAAAFGVVEPAAFVGAFVAVRAVRGVPLRECSVREVAIGPLPLFLLLLIGNATSEKHPQRSYRPVGEWLQAPNGASCTAERAAQEHPAPLRKKYESVA